MSLVIMYVHRATDASTTLSECAQVKSIHGKHAEILKKNHSASHSELQDIIK